MGIGRLGRALFAGLGSAVAVIAVAVPTTEVVSAATAGSSPPDAHVVLYQGHFEGCELAALDLATGVVTDLPAQRSFEACVPIAQTTDGTVLGICATPTGPPFVQACLPRPGEDAGLRLVTFAADGTPSSTPVAVDGTPSGSASPVAIAVGADGTIRILAFLATSTEPSCDGVGVCLLVYDPASGIATPVGGSGPSVESRPIGLTDCAGGLLTGVGLRGLQLSVVDRATGAVAIGPVTPAWPVGCPPGGDPLYAITLTSESGEPLTYELGVLDPRSVAYRPLSAVRVDGVDPSRPVNLSSIIYLAVGRAGPLAPTTTTTTRPVPAQVAASTEAVPAFTG